ncbi:MAG: hypothetical protein IV112_08345 [Methyloversatilis discipulorum]|uniref:gp53-like domain-containing protein n=1 Tax=Methyloversatilis discipulorum TaxID=1119528 RepID=UPI0026F2FFC1|nr:hypothetical protein [Methyloversatilis discipulorum]MBT9516690.1 hypothetical protein [Methyloversatilis discipulorum]
MAITKPDVLPPWAESGDAVQPTNAEIQVGWPAGATPPSRQRFNWILNYCMNGVRYLVRRGLSDWDAAETYAIGDRVIGPTGSTYQALTANTNKTPASNPSDWALWAFGPSDVATDSSDNSGKIATTSWIRSAMSNIASVAGFESLFAPAGYVVLPSWLGGLIIQWGNISAVASGASATITYPISFLNARYAFSAIGNSPSPGAITFENVTPLVSERVWNQSGASRNVFWFAVGH